MAIHPGGSALLGLGPWRTIFGSSNQDTEGSPGRQNPGLFLWGSATLNGLQSTGGGRDRNPAIYHPRFDQVRLSGPLTFRTSREWGHSILKRYAVYLTVERHSVRYWGSGWCRPPVTRDAMESPPGEILGGFLLSHHQLNRLTHGLSRWARKPWSSPIDQPSLPSAMTDTKLSVTGVPTSSPRNAGVGAR